MSDTRPIGIFDSGIGGLTVLKSVLERLPQENVVYLGDTARLPYGSKSPETVAKYCRQNLHWLEGQNIKAAVVACNTASSVLLQKPLGESIFNVIGPGARVAAKLTQNGKIGVLATRATVQGKAYAKALHAINAGLEVYQQPAPLLVPLVEEGWTDDPITNLVIYRYLTPLLQSGIDTLILGCTHYPVLSAAIAKVAGAHVKLVDSAAALSEDLAVSLKNLNQLNLGSQKRSLEIFTTDSSAQFHEVAKMIMHDPELPKFTQVDL